MIRVPLGILLPHYSQAWSCVIWYSFKRPSCEIFYTKNLYYQYWSIRVVLNFHWCDRFKLKNFIWDTSVSLPRLSLQAGGSSATPRTVSIRVKLFALIFWQIVWPHKCFHITSTKSSCSKIRCQRISGKMGFPDECGREGRISLALRKTWKLPHGCFVITSRDRYA
jgi:hypothetical protein